MNVRILPMKGYQQPYGQSVEVVENRFFYEGAFVCHRRRLHRFAKMPS